MRTHHPSRIPGIVLNFGYDPIRSYGMADLHLHSHYSHDVINLPELSPRALYDRAVRLGMDFFTLTDHGTIKGIEALRRSLAADYGSDWPIPVIPGIEMTIRDPAIGHTVHINVLGMDRPQLVELARRRRHLSRFLAFCRAERLCHVYNHPFWFRRGERGDPRVIRSLFDEFSLIELNAGRIPPLNARTLSLALSRHRSLVATSDSHTGRVGRAVTYAPGRTVQEFLHNLEAGVSAALPHHTSFLSFARELEETVDLAFAGSRPLRLKRSFLREMPRAQRLTQAAVGSDRIMKQRAVNRLVRSGLRILVLPPAFTFVRGQASIDAWLTEVRS
jgi:predicted metal-dependent phosphoesterase TrpH